MQIISESCLPPKQELYKVKSIERRKDMIIKEMKDIVEEKKALADTITAFYGETRVQDSKIADPTYKRAVQACDNLLKKYNNLLHEWEELSFESEYIEEKFKECFTHGDMIIQEYEALFYYFFDYKTNEEIAELMHYSIESVYKFKASGMKKFEKYLTDNDEGMNKND